MSVWRPFEVSCYGHGSSESYGKVLIMKAKKGDAVSIHYTGRLEDGTVFDSSQGRDPISFVVGSGSVIPGFDDAAEGMKPSEKKEVNIPPDRAYGEHSDDMVQKVPRSLAGDDTPEAGQVVELGSPDGQTFNATVVGVDDEWITVDFNHPLAGKTLIFDIEMCEVKSEA